MTKVIKNLTVFISGDPIGSLCINYDLKVNYDEPPSNHPDNLSSLLNEEREVTINSVEFQLLDKKTIDITATAMADKKILSRLEDKVLDEIEGEAIEDLIGEEKEPVRSDLFNMMADITCAHAKIVYGIDLKGGVK